MSTKPPKPINPRPLIKRLYEENNYLKACVATLLRMCDGEIFIPRDHPANRGDAEFYIRHEPEGVRLALTPLDVPEGTKTVKVQEGINEVIKSDKPL